MQKELILEKLPGGAGKRRLSGMRGHGHLWGRFQGDKYYLEGQV